MTKRTNMSLITLPEEILENIFYQLSIDIYNNIINGYFVQTISDVKSMMSVCNTCKLFKTIIKTVVNYLYECDKNILFELYEYNFSISDLIRITKYMYVMGIDMQNITTEKNNLITYLVDNHYYKSEYAVFNNDFNKLLETLLNLHVDPNIVNIYGNTALLYNFKLIFNDESDNIENVLFSTINTYINNKNFDCEGLNIQDINGNTVMHIIMQMFSAIANYNYYPQEVYEQLFAVLDKINIKNNEGKTPLLEII